MTIKHVIFDLDGVLLDTLTPERARYSSIVSQFNRGPLTEDEFNYMKKSGPKDILNYCLSNSSDVEKAFVIHEASLKEHNSVFPLFDKVIETLDALQESGVSLSVASSRDETIYPILSANKLASYFSKNVICSKHYNSSEYKPHPTPIHLAMGLVDAVNPDEVVYIGDQKVDMIAAEKAGVNFIGFNLDTQVSTNYFPDLIKLIENI